MPKILLIMSNTGTIVSKMIKKVTGNTYNHVSVSLSKDLSEMYSFGRINPYVFFYGGFVQEHPDRGTFKRFKNTSCAILELDVSEESFSIISDIINNFQSERKKFKYNVRGLFKARKNVNYQTTYRKFYCSQFVRYLLVCAHILPENFCGSVVTPQDFFKVPGAALIYEGLLRDYISHPIEAANADEIGKKESASK